MWLFEYVEASLPQPSIEPPFEELSPSLSRAAIFTENYYSALFRLINASNYALYSLLYRKRLHRRHTQSDRVDQIALYQRYWAKCAPRVA